MDLMQKFKDVKVSVVLVSSELQGYITGQTEKFIILDDEYVINLDNVLYITKVADINESTEHFLKNVY